MVADNLPHETSPKTTIFIVEDQNLYLRGLQLFIDQYSEFEVVGTANNAAKAYQEIKKLKPQIIIIDIYLHDSNGLTLLKELKKQLPKTRALILSETDDEELINQLVEFGADSYVLKSESNIEIYKSLSSMAGGQPYFSPNAGLKFFSALQNLLVESNNDSINTMNASITKREKQIAQLLKLGKTNKEIASELDCSAFTVKCHKANLMRKIHVNSSAEIVQWFSKQKL